MSEPLHYAKAPITEATIDLRMTLPDGATMAQLEELRQALGEQYPESQQVYQDQLLFSVGSHHNTAEQQSRHIGFRLVSADKHKIAHIRLDGCAFTLLHPYDRWEPFRDDARALWNLYREILRPTSIRRVSVRYINRLNIPFASVELKKYLRTVPEISADLPQMVLSYFMQLIIPQEHIQAVAAINQAIVRADTPDTTSVILDIDVFRDLNIPADESVWNLFEQLRDSKNAIFKACLTPEAEALIS